MMNRYILFQAYGNPAILAECRFALMQLMQYNNPKNICLVLYTDNPDYFAEELKIFDNHIIEMVTPELLTIWRGKIDFVHRVKVEIIQHFFCNHTGSVLYFDTDTYCMKPINGLFEQIESDAVIMHINEGLIDESNNAQIKKWNRLLTTKNIFVNEKSISDISGITMWNAGVIGIHSNRAHLLKEVLAITDTIYPIFPKHTVEQFAFSYVLQKNVVVSAADDFLFHYWDLKEYRLLLTKFYQTNKGSSLQEMGKKLKTFLPELIMRDKLAYNKMPFYKKIFIKKWTIDNYVTNLMNNSI